MKEMQHKQQGETSSNAIKKAIMQTNEEVGSVQFVHDSFAPEGGRLVPLEANQMQKASLNPFTS